MKALVAKLTSLGLLASVAIHASAGTSFWLWVKWRDGGEIREFELATTTQQASPKAGKKAVVEDDDFFLIAKKPPKATLQTPALAGEACKGTCTESATGDFIAASDAARKPRWVGNFITHADYPAIARSEGKDGRVLLSVIINDDGSVRSVELIAGSYSALNEVALAKVKNALFSPAYDADGNAVACKVRLPIRFELK